MAKRDRVAQDYLRLHAVLPTSQSNGPGNRAVVWLQGCSLGCPGCFNPETHSTQRGYRESVFDLVNWVQSMATSGIEGITISGGEPLQQIKPLQLFLTQLKSQAPNLSIILFSGYNWSEIQKMPGAKKILPCLDVLIAGRYDESHRIARDLRGSNNKTIHFLSNRYHIDDLHITPISEIIIEPDGQIIFSGIDPIIWNKE